MVSVDELTPRQRLMLFWVIALSLLCLSGSVFLIVLINLGVMSLYGIVLGAGHSILLIGFWVWVYFLKQRGWKVKSMLLLSLLYALAVPYPYYMFLQLPQIKAGGHLRPMIEQLIGMFGMGLAFAVVLCWREYRSDSR